MQAKDLDPSHKIDFSKIRLLRILLCITGDEEKNGHLLNDGVVCMYYEHRRFESQNTMI